METQEIAHAEPLKAKLAWYHDALAGMAAELQALEKRSSRHEAEKAQLAARIADLDRRNAVLNSHLHDTAASGTARFEELQRELAAERERSADLRSQLDAGEQAMLEHQQEMAAAADEHARRCEELRAEISELSARIDESKVATDAAAAAAETERAGLLATIAERDAEVARLGELVRTLEATAADDAAAAAAAASERDSLLATIAERDATVGQLEENVRALEAAKAARAQRRRRKSRSRPASDDTPAGEGSQVTNASVLISMGNDGETRHTLCKSVMVIGRSGEADIHVDGPHTSRRHARLLVSDSAVTIEDMASLNGTIVNGQPVQRCELGDGDVLDIGGARLRFVTNIA